MPAIQGRTRLQIRQAIGYSLRALQMLTATSDGATAATRTFVTDDLWGGASDHNGKWWVGTDTPNAGVYARVVASAIASNVTTLTLQVMGNVALAATLTDDTAELWAMRYDPKMIEEFINQAIIEVTGLAYDPEESLALHGDGRQKRFDVPAEFKMVNGIYLRDQVESTQIHLATTAWDEAAAPANVTRSVDTKDYKRPPGSNKFVIAGAFATGDISSKAISSLDLSGYDYVEFWVKSTTATVAGDFRLVLAEGTLLSSNVEELDFPALVADTWTYVRVALADPADANAIISVGLQAMNNIAANTIWINDVKAVLDSTAVWVPMDRQNWRVEEELRDIVTLFAPAYKLLKLTGGDTPALLSADATANEIDDQYVIARATELALISSGPSTQTEAGIAAWRGQLAYWSQQAEVAKRSLPWLVGARVVS